MPENTILGIRAALDAGVDAIEFDVHATADGIPVLLHDETLARTTGDQRAIAEVASGELATIRTHLDRRSATPQPVSSLADALTVIAGHAVAVIEVKAHGIDDLVASVVHEAMADAWTWIWTFDLDIARACRDAMPSVPVSLNVGSDGLEAAGSVERILELCTAERLAGVAWDHRLVDASTLHAARGQGLATYCWTVNEPGDIARMVEAGVDGICSDFPERVSVTLDRD